MRVYRIFIPISKEELKRTIKRTTYELTIENQNYRKVYLSKIEDDDIYLSRSRASFDGSGLEMLHLYDISERGNGILMNGGFEPLFEIRYKSLFLLIVAILAVLWFCIPNGIFILLIGTIIVILPTILIYKVLPKIVVSKKGRQKILDYVENELGGEIETLEPDKRQKWKDLLDSCRNAFRWKRKRGRRSYERDRGMGNKIEITLCGENDAESVLRYIQAHAKPYNLINREMELYQVLCSEKMETFMRTFHGESTAEGSKGFYMKKMDEPISKGVLDTGQGISYIPLLSLAYGFLDLLVGQCKLGIL